MLMFFYVTLIVIQLVSTSVTAVTYACSTNQICGCSLHPANFNKIVGGETAGADTWAWAVSIRSNNGHFCGGTLISPTLVLTAAHCFASMRSIASLSIHVGSKYLSQTRQQRRISQVYIARNYDSDKFLHDIAMLRLSEPVDMTDTSVSLLCLPASDGTDYPPKGAAVVAIGWGILTPGSRIPSEALQQVTLNAMSSRTDSSCVKLINNADSQFCAGVQGGGKDTCQGDSGGPLMLFTNGRWEIVGITSYGSGCALPEYPGVYTRITSYRRWISCFLLNDTSCIRSTSSMPNFVSSRTSSTIVYTCNRRSSCGCSAQNQPSLTLSRIIGGEPVRVPSAWGWMGSLRRDNLHQCGASLLSPNFAITAAHCVQDLKSLSQLSLNLGTHNLTVIGDLHQISRIIVHPDYDRSLFTNDLAILVLTRPVDMVRFNITSICLPTQYNLDDTTSESPAVGEDLVAIGWGTTVPFRRMASMILRQVTLKAIADDTEACVNSINDNVVQFCAGSLDGKKDTCAGDSGGPLMMFRDGRWYLLGITSYGSACADPHHPGIYTRVSYYDSFIRHIINEKKLPEANAKELDHVKVIQSKTVTIFYSSSVFMLFLSLCIYQFFLM